MRGIFKLLGQEARLVLREPVMAFFGLAFPPLIMLLFGASIGNEPNPMYGGLGPVDVAVPSFVAMLIGISSFMSLPITVAGYRERGILRRYRTTPISPLAVLGVQLVIQYFMTALGVVVMAVIGRLVFSMRFAGSIPAVFAGFSFSCLSFFSLGMVLASVAPSARASVVIGNVALYSMVYLSGATIPTEALPKAVRELSRWIPMSHIVNMMRGLWAGDALSAHGLEFLVLGAMMAVALVVALLTFRWE
jgi:ABC-2 type transport system permease protein